MICKIGQVKDARKTTPQPERLQAVVGHYGSAITQGTRRRPLPLLGCRDGGLVFFNWVLPVEPAILNEPCE